MWDPWESLKVNVPRKLLAAIQADSGNGEQPGFAVYDVSDCRRPVLKSSVVLSVPVKGHAGEFAQDGRTYYGTQIGVSTYAIDDRQARGARAAGQLARSEQGMGLPHDVSTQRRRGSPLHRAAGRAVASGARTSDQRPGD